MAKRTGLLGILAASATILGGCKTNIEFTQSEVGQVKDVVRNEDLQEWISVAYDATGPYDGKGPEILALGSLITTPNLNPRSYGQFANTSKAWLSMLQTGLKRGDPNWNIYFSPDFAKAYERDPSIREMVTEKIGLKNCSGPYILEGAQARLMEEGKYGRMLPSEHFKALADQHPGALLNIMSREDQYPLLGKWVREQKAK